MNIYYHLFYSFIIYSFLGWTIEVIYQLYKQKRFVNRGFLHGPLCPIYGSTSVLLQLVLAPISYNILYIFIMGVIFASIIEYVTGYLMELFLHTKWWDYSDESYNIKGYICLKFSIFWGILSVVFIKLINPPISRLVYLSITQFGEVLYNIILIIFITDVSLTINGLITFRKVFSDLQEVLMERKENMEKLLERTLNIEIRENIQHRINNLGELKDRIAKRVSFRHKDMLRAYPHISSKRFDSALEEIKKRIEKIKR